MVYEREPALHCVRITAGNAYTIPRSIEPLLDICDEKKGSGDEVVEKDGGNPLIIILGACGFLVNKRVVNFESWRGTKRGSIEDSDWTFYGVRYTLDTYSDVRRGGGEHVSRRRQ